MMMRGRNGLQHIWIKDPFKLPKNVKTALARLNLTEKRLHRLEDELPSEGHVNQMACHTTMQESPDFTQIWLHD